MYKVHVHVIRVVLKLVEDAFAVGVYHNFDQNFNFLKLQVQRIIELAEEHFDAVFKNGGLFLKDKVNVP